MSSTSLLRTSTSASSSRLPKATRWSPGLSVVAPTIQKNFYDFHLIPGGWLGVVVGDATGKGVPAALVMATTCGMLQLAAQALGSSSPGEVLAQVNETIVGAHPLQHAFVRLLWRPET